jgi:CheY-like chemotaxis protein
MRGYKVVECGDPKAALELVEDGRGRKLDMILTDMIMPGLSGDELVRRVRLKVPGIKVLFISGYDKPSTLSAREVAPLLMKPFTPAELVSKVEQVLHQPLLVI